MKRFPVLLIFITILIDLIGFGIVIPVLPYYVGTEPFNATPLTFGWLVASFSIMQFIFSPILGKLSDKYGRRPILFLSLIGTGIGFLVLGFATTMWMVFAGRILDGITGGNISTAQAYIADVTTPENRARGMGMIGAAFGIGFVLGPAIGGILSPFGLAVPFYFAAGLAFLNATALYFVLPETVKKGEHKAEESSGRFNTLLKYLRDPRLGLLILIYFLVTVAFSILTTAFIIYTAHRFGYTARQNGFVFAYIGVIGIMIQGGLMGIATKKFGENLLVIIGTVLMAVALFFVPLVGPESGGLTGLLIGIAVFSFGSAFAGTPLVALASKSVSAREQGVAMGVMQSAASLARAVGPALTGLLLSAAVATETAPDNFVNSAIGNVTDFTIERTFWTAAAIMVPTFLMAVYFARRHKQPPVAAA
ncbi:MAG TPA: MFS transporter [Pyrinomonadaceae bacterium]|jgi:DHA1 family tetracycline resistance protein-like MFS transporter|nr:MFS transporter [Pyrinomonadaceae bacterium]